MSAWLSAASPVAASAKLGLAILTLSMVLVLFRLIRGTRGADRIIALDLLSILVVAFVALYAVFSGDAVYLDIVISYALVAFLGTVAFARYIERAKVNQAVKPTSSSRRSADD
jgi:multicomponent Na+:H+ antiporter subunit F